MKSFFSHICIVFIVLGCAFFGPHCVAQESESTVGKTYISPEHVRICREAILVKYNGGWFSTESLGHDGKGLYVQSLVSPAYGCADPYVPCRNCKRCVYEAWDICPYCGKPI